LKEVRASSLRGLYVAAIALSFVDPLIAGIIYVSVAVMWLIPDRRIERALSEWRRKLRQTARSLGVAPAACVQSTSC